MRALAALCAALCVPLAASAAEELLLNGDFAGAWEPLQRADETGTAEGQIPERWEDVSTWSGASTRYSRADGPAGEGPALRLEMTQATLAHSVLQLRSGFDLQMREGGVYRITLHLHSPTGTPAEIAIRQHQEPRIRFWQVRVPCGDEWRRHEFIAEPAQGGPARFFVAIREVGLIEVADMSVTELSDAERPEPPPPTPLRGVRCVQTRGDLIKHSDIIAMYQEAKVETLRKYRVDVVAWGGQMRAAEGQIAARRELIDRAHQAGVRLHAVDCALVQEGGRFVVAGGDRGSETYDLFWDLRKDNEGAIARLEELGVDLRQETVLDISGDWIGVPWLRKRWRIPLASVHSPRARQWFREHMDALAQTGLSALHFDEPGMGSYGVQSPTPGDFSDHAVAAFRDWLAQRPEAVWRDAGIDSLDDFDYRELVRAHGGAPRRAPLWREFVRFQLFATADFVRELRDRVREKSGRRVPLSMNANAGSWIKLPFIELQDFMTTEVAHQAKSRRVPTAPLLVYKLGDAFRQPVAGTAHGHDWYEMKTDQHPVLVSAWMAMGYALGHHLMIPCKAWVMDPVKGSDTYRPTTDHYACLARFIKHVGPLLDGYAPVSVAAVCVGCDALERDRAALDRLVTDLADANIPFSMAVEGNDLLDREIGAADLDGCSAVLIASAGLMSPEATERIRELAGERPVAEHFGAALPRVLPRPIEVEGADNVWVLPRMAPGDDEAPVAIHLLNRDYDAEARAMRTKGPFTIRLDPALFGGREFAQATLHRPRLFAELPEDDAACHEAIELTVLSTAEAIEMTVPSLELWGLIELRL